MIDDTKLRLLIAEDEGQYHDRKSLLEGPPGQKRPRDRKVVRDQIAEYVASFANAEGGVLICGVENDGTITGHRYPSDQVDTMLQVPATRLVPPQPAGRRVVLDGVEVLVFEVEMSAVAVQVSSDGYPYRIGDTTTQWSEAKINATKERWTEAFERRYLAWLLRRADGNISKAARDADMDRKYLHKLLRKYGIGSDEPAEE